MNHDLFAIGFLFLGIFGLIALEIGGDVLIARYWGIDATISRAMHRTRRIVVFAFGALYGFAGGFLSAHFWWGVGSPDVDSRVVITQTLPLISTVSRRQVPRYAISEIRGALGVLTEYANDDKVGVEWSYSLRVVGVPGPDMMDPADAAKLKRLGWYWDVNYRDWSLDRLDWMTKPGDHDDWTGGEVVHDYEKRDEDEDMGALTPEDLKPNGWSMGSF